MFAQHADNRDCNWRFLSSPFPTSCSARWPTSGKVSLVRDSDDFSSGPRKLFSAEIADKQKKRRTRTTVEVIQSFMIVFWKTLIRFVLFLFVCVLKEMLFNPIVLQSMRGTGVFFLVVVVRSMNCERRDE